jgi:hypothetical protein
MPATGNWAPPLTTMLTRATFVFFLRSFEILFATMHE